MDYINRWLGSELLMFCVLPWGYAAAVASLLILMFSKKRSRQILLWVLLPQWAFVVLLLPTLQYTQLLSQTGTVWMLMLLLPILSWAGLAARAAAGNLAAQAVARMATVPYCVHWDAVPGDAGAVACY